MLPCRDIFAVPDTVLLHRRFTLRKRDISVSRNSLTCYTGRHLRIRRLILFIFAGAVYDNALTDCAALSCRACVDLITCVAERYLTLRTGCEKHGRKNPLSFPYFAAVTCRQSAPDPLRERGNSQEGGNRRCLPSCAPARRQRNSPPRDAAHSPPVRDEHACAVRVPRRIGAKKKTQRKPSAFRIKAI